MKIAKKFKLGKSQYEVDFVDIDTNKDAPIFIDPKLISRNTDKWSIETQKTISNFWQTIISQIRSGDIEKAKHNFIYLSEPNETCLGLSKGKPKGKGVGKKDAKKIFNEIIRSGVVSKGLVENIEDVLLFIEGFGRDKLSDLTTNIIKKHLSEYTKEQCNLHNIPIEGLFPFWFWNPVKSIWERDYLPAISIKNQKILLTPKIAVSYCKDYIPEKYYNNIVLNFIGDEHLQNLTPGLVHERKSGKLYTIKKELRKNHPYSKDFLRDFTDKHKDLLEGFRKNTKIRGVSDDEITEISLTEVVDKLKDNLKKVVPGNTDAGKYHNLMIGALELIFHPQLTNPIKEKEIYEGRKRVDIAFQNASQEGLFDRLPRHYRLTSGTIFVECKNYSSDIENPELDQLSGRFSYNVGRVGILVCRSIKDRDLFIERCKDTFKADRGLVIPLVDNDIINLLDAVKRDSKKKYKSGSEVDKILSEITESIMVS